MAKPQTLSNWSAANSGQLLTCRGCRAAGVDDRLQRPQGQPRICRVRLVPCNSNASLRATAADVTSSPRGGHDSAQRSGRPIAWRIETKSSHFCKVSRCVRAVSVDDGGTDHLACFCRQAGFAVALGVRMDQLSNPHGVPAQQAERGKSKAESVSERRNSASCTAPTADHSIGSPAVGATTTVHNAWAMRCVSFTALSSGNRAWR